jgi:hypothetical protein
VAEDRLKIWETLFQRALALIDSTREAGLQIEDWTFGGGTVLMRRHHHRFSKDIDIFVLDPQFLGYLSPRVNTTAERLTSNYLEQAGFLKLSFAEGEIDFVASPLLTPNPTVVETLFGRKVSVETSAEIMGKKVKHRGSEFTARDILDLAMVSEKEPPVLSEIRSILQERRDAILARMKSRDAALREDFKALEILDYRRSYDECAEIVTKILTAG